MATAPAEQRLHSRYHPEREAARFLDHNPPDSSCSDILVLGPGEGYLFPELARRYPHARLLGIELCESSDGSAAKRAAHALYRYAGREGLRSFLDREIIANDPAKLAIISWPPALRAEPEKAKECLETLRDWTERLVASHRTLKAFGERWVINAFRSLALPHARFSMDHPAGPVVLASAGPSLEETTETILKQTPRKDYLLVAVSSAAPALLARGLTPDMVICSDGGNWAQWHLRELSRRKVPLLYQLGAAIPSSLQGSPLQVSVTGQAWQDGLLALRGIPALRSIQRGTVSAVALDIVLEISSHTVYLAGLDLESAAIRSHASPHAFDALAIEGESRTSPLWNWYEDRRRLYRDSRAMDIYAQWYREQAHERRSRCRVLSASARPLFGIDGASRIAATGIAGGTISMKCEASMPPWPPKTADCVEKLLEEPRSRRELAELLGVAEAVDGTIEERLFGLIERASGRR